MKNWKWLQKYNAWFEEKLKGECEEKISFFKFLLPTIALFFIYSAFIADDNLIRYFKSLYNIKRQKALIENYQKDIEKMDERIHILKNNKDSLEKFARETFHFSAPGEDVYLIEE